MRGVFSALAAALLLAAVACSAPGYGGGGAPKATAAPSFMPTPTGSRGDPYGY
jgi:hypothetical protein